MERRRPQSTDGRRSRTISVSSHHSIVSRRDPITLFENEDDKVLTLTYIRATAALIGSVFMWVGAWNFCTEGVTERHRHGTTKYVLLPRSYFRHLLYFFIGLLSLVICDTLYSNAGFTGYYWGSWFFGKSKYRIIRFLSRVVHVAWSLTGMFLFWVALYDITDYTINPSAWKDVSCLCLGVAFLVLSNTFYHMAYLYPEGTEEEDPTTGSSIRSHALRTGKALFSMFAQNLIWLGAYHLLDLYFERSMFRELFYAAVGLFLIRATNSYIANAYISPDFEEARPQKPSLAFFVKCFLSLAGQVIFNTGVWTFIDVYLFVDSPNRDLTYICIGCVVLFMTDTLASNAAVYPLADEDDVLEAIGLLDDRAPKDHTFRPLPSTLVNE